MNSTIHSKYATLINLNSLLLRSSYPRFQVNKSRYTTEHCRQIHELASVKAPHVKYPATKAATANQNHATDLRGRVVPNLDVIIDA